MFSLGRILRVTFASFTIKRSAITGCRDTPQTYRDKVKHYIAIGLLLVSSESVAIECGQKMREATIKDLGDSIGVARQRLLEHSKGLHEDVKGLLSTARSGDDLRPIQQLQDEMGLIEFAEKGGRDVEAEMRFAGTLALIRDAMVDAKDKAVVSWVLSNHLYTTGKLAEATKPLTSFSLRKITRPGIAVDVAKLQDAIEAVVRHLSECTAPPKKAPMQRHLR